MRVLAKYAVWRGFVCGCYLLVTTKPASVASAAKADESDRLVMKPQQDTPRPEHVPTLRTSNQSMLTETKLASTITSQSSRAATQQTSSQLTSKLRQTVISVCGVISKISVKCLCASHWPVAFTISRHGVLF